jgi:hypothetical protein
VNATAWSRGLEVTGGGTGVVSRTGLVLVRHLADRTSLTARLSAALPTPDGGLDRGRVFADLACAIADGARVISDFRVMGDQDEVFGQVASVPTAWRTLKEIAAGGDRTRRKITAAVSKARRYAWAQAAGPDGQLLPVQIADRQLAGITCLRLDATVVTAHSQRAGRAELQGLRPSSPPGRMRQHARAGGVDDAAGLGREQHRRGPPDAPRRGDRGAPAAAPAEADGHLRRRRRQP